LANSDAEWFSLLEKIYLEPSSAEAVASAGRETIKAQYSQQSLEKRWASSLIESAKRPSSEAR